MVKRSKGKSIRFAKWLGQNMCVFETRGKSDEWDITRGRNVPNFYEDYYGDGDE